MDQVAGGLFGAYARAGAHRTLQNSTGTLVVLQFLAQEWLAPVLQRAPFGACNSQSELARHTCQVSSMAAKFETWHDPAAAPASNASFMKMGTGYTGTLNL
jgi:hypothetical protein